MLINEYNLLMGVKPHKKVLFVVPGVLSNASCIMYYIIIMHMFCYIQVCGLVEINRYLQILLPQIIMDDDNKSTGDRHSAAVRDGQFLCC